MCRVTSLFAIALAVASPWAAAADWQPVAARAAALSTLPAGSEGEAQVADALRLPKCGGYRCSPPPTPRWKSAVRMRAAGACSCR